MIIPGFGTYCQTNDWFSLPEEVNGPVKTMAVYQGNLIVAGNFSMTGSLANNDIAAWNGSFWTDLGSGITSTGISVVQDMLVHNDSLFVVGTFEKAGGITSNNVAVWSGSFWSGLGTGANNNVAAVAVYNNEIYVAGAFDSIGGIQARGVAKWNGVSWEALGAGLRYNVIYQDVAELFVYDNKLFATGFIDSAGNIGCSNVAYWDGLAWGTIPSALSTMYITDMIEWDGALLFGSSYVNLGSDLLVNIDSWSGTTYNVMSSENMSSIDDFEIYNGDLYGGGDDWSYDYGCTVRRWDGTTWTQAGSGLNDGVRSLCTYDGELYAGGYFSTTSGSNHNYIARYAELNALPPSDAISIIGVYPNPVSGRLTVDFSLIEEAYITIGITDINGRSVGNVRTQNYTSGQHRLDFEVSGLSNGVYFVKVQVNDQSYYERIVKR